MLVYNSMILKSKCLTYYSTTYFVSCCRVACFYFNYPSYYIYINNKYLYHPFGESIIEISILIQQKLHLGLQGFISVPLHHQELVVNLCLPMILILKGYYVGFILLQLIVVLL